MKMTDELRLAPFTYSPIHPFTILSFTSPLYNDPRIHTRLGGNMRDRLVVLALCLVLLAGVAAAAKFNRRYIISDGPLGRLGLIVRGHGLDAPGAGP